eukprot:scaffold8296_cov18-Prasinocladus_malaysianus.AAC.1
METGKKEKEKGREVHMATTSEKVTSKHKSKGNERRGEKRRQAKSRINERFRISHRVSFYK